MAKGRWSRMGFIGSSGGPRSSQGRPSARSLRTPLGLALGYNAGIRIPNGPAMPASRTAPTAARAFMPYPDAAVPHAATGPLSGLSFGVKDLFDVAGYPTSGGQPFVLAMSGIKTTTAPTVQRLLDAGARFAGKTVTDELAFSMNGQNAHFGSPVNGAAPERITGGSSSGSAAAVSHGLCDFALGTDTGGSVRAPANHCGLVGLRPTHGRVSLEGALDLAPSLDTCGWFTRDIATFARVADVLLGADPAPLPPTACACSIPARYGPCSPPRCCRRSRRRARASRPRSAEGRSGRGGARRLRDDVLELPLRPGARGLDHRRRADRALRPAARPRAWRSALPGHATSPTRRWPRPAPFAPAFAAHLARAARQRRRAA